MKCSGPLHRQGGAHVHTQTQLHHQILRSEQTSRLGVLCFQVQFLDYMI